MNIKFIFGLLIIALISTASTAQAYNSYDLNKRLVSCTPTRDYNAGSIAYRITGLMGSSCVFRIVSLNSNKSDLICRVPYEKMREMTSVNPLIVQNLKNRYCKIALQRVNNQGSEDRLNKSSDMLIYY